MEGANTQHQRKNSTPFVHHNTPHHRDAVIAGPQAGHPWNEATWSRSRRVDRAFWSPVYALSGHDSLPCPRPRPFGWKRFDGQGCIRQVAVRQHAAFGQRFETFLFCTRRRMAMVGISLCCSWTASRVPRSGCCSCHVIHPLSPWERKRKVGPGVCAKAPRLGQKLLDHPLESAPIRSSPGWLLLP